MRLIYLKANYLELYYQERILETQQQTYWQRAVLLLFDQLHQNRFLYFPSLPHSPSTEVHIVYVRYFIQYTIQKEIHIAGGRGCRGARIPAKMTSEPQDLQNYLQAPQNWSPSLCDVTKTSAILSPRPAFWSPLVVFIFCLNLLA